MLRTIWFIILFWGMQLVLMPYLGLLLLLRLCGYEGTSRRMARAAAARWSRQMLWLARSKVTVHGAWPLAPGEAGLVVSNHQGAFDIAILLGYIGTPVAFVAKQELAKIPLIGAWMKAIDCVFISRADKRQVVEVTQKTSALLQAGASMVVFPEGTRSNGPDMYPYKKGSLGLAKRAGVPVVPVAVKNSWAILENQRVNQASVEVYIGEPIAPASLSREEGDLLHEQVQAWAQEQIDASVMQRG